MIKKMIVSLTWICLSACLVCSGCAKEPRRANEFMMGTFVEVICEDPRAERIVFEEFKKVERMVSLFDKESELSRLNRDGDMTASEEFFDLLVKSKTFYEMTDGAFDVTVAPVAELWKKAIHKEELPKEEELRGLLGLVGFDYVFLNGKNRNVKLLKRGAKIDLGSIAKGYAVDRAVARLREARISSAVVNAGGDLYCLGESRQGLWRVGIRDPRVAKRLIEKMTLKNKGVATSGDYEQFFIFENKRYSHIIDPGTGYPAESGIVSATVVAPDVLTADALATSFVVLGQDRSEAILKQMKNVGAALVGDDGKVRDFGLLAL
jgi:thiamine biosynthesis lipoprotein